MPETEALAAFARTRATLVLHLAITRIKELAAELVGEYGADCPVVVGYRIATPQQRVLRGTLADIADQVEEAGLRRAAVILVGRALGVSHGAATCVESHLYDPARERPGRRASG
jgi:precorrin-4/cobalt-precorrin-4 C11-methyltransferase